jgi:hypothetical protein
MEHQGQDHHQKQAQVLKPLLALHLLLLPKSSA